MPMPQQPTRFPNRLFRHCSFAAFAIFFGSAAVAQASPQFPAAVQNIPSVSIHLDCVPDCTTCHLESPGAAANLGPFGLYLFTKWHVPPQNPAALVQAIEDTASMDPTHDADQDGFSDIMELQAGANPNFAGTAPLCTGLKYGCGASVAPHPAVNRLGLLSALSMVFGLGLMVLRRRTR